MAEKRKTFDILMGVGAKYYPAPEFFIAECLYMGISKRIADFPPYYNPVKNRLYLVHWANRKIFGYATNLRFTVIACPDSILCEKMKKKYGEEVVQCICPEDVAMEGERGCGYVVPQKQYVHSKKK